MALVSSFLGGASIARANDSDDSSKTSFSFERLGLTPFLRDESTDGSMSFHFNTRADQVLTSARLQVRFSARRRSTPPIERLEVAINQELVAGFSAAALEASEWNEVEIDSRLITERNLLTLSLKTSGQAACADRVPRGAWQVIESGALVTESSPIPLRNDLALLPLPFFDDHVDDQATIPIVFLVRPTPSSVRASSLIAAFFGMRVGSKIRFPVSFGELPQGPAVVLSSTTSARDLRISPVLGPSVTMVDHPDYPESNRKLLVVSGRDLREIEAAAEAFALSARPLRGPSVTYDGFSSPPPRQPYDAPRWTPIGARRTFDEIAGVSKLSHKGAKSGTMKLSFRIPPDLFVWPAENVLLDLSYAQEAPQPGLFPELDVEFNGHFLKTLRPYDTENTVSLQRARLELHRSHLRGYNELAIHVNYRKQSEALCDPKVSELLRTVITPASSIHLEDLPTFAPLPNMFLFVHDGFPFTRRPDLGDSIVVLPEHPHAKEISTLLSAFAHFAAVTGVPGNRAAFHPADGGELPHETEKDLLFIGAADRLPLLERWADHAPLRLSSGRQIVQRPAQTNPLLELLSARPVGSELDRARAVLAQSPKTASAFGFESPLWPRRSVVAITAPEPEDMPSLSDLQGHAESRSHIGDLMLLGNRRLWLFRVGANYHFGDVDTWTRLRWFVATHWLMLFPCFLVGTLLPAWVFQRRLAARALRRSAAAPRGESA